MPDTIWKISGIKIPILNVSIVWLANETHFFKDSFSQKRLYLLTLDFVSKTTTRHKQQKHRLRHLHVIIQLLNSSVALCFCWFVQIRGFNECLHFCSNVRYIVWLESKNISEVCWIGCNKQAVLNVLCIWWQSTSQGQEFYAYRPLVWWLCTDIMCLICICNIT